MKTAEKLVPAVVLWILCVLGILSDIPGTHFSVGPIGIAVTCDRYVRYIKTPKMQASYTIGYESAHTARRRTRIPRWRQCSNVVKQRGRRQHCGRCAACKECNNRLAETDLGFGRARQRADAGGVPGST